jgi:hypothetical protein
MAKNVRDLETLIFHAARQIRIGQSRVVEFDLIEHTSELEAFNTMDWNTATPDDLRRFRCLLRATERSLKAVQIGKGI